MTLLALLLGCAAEPLVVSAPAARDVDDGLEVLFAPEDDCVAVELAEIERVVSARLSDPDGGDYAIRYAAYNLRNPDIVDALIGAREAGVFVQILVEADQLDPSRDWNTADEQLVEAGFTYAPDHRALSASDRLTTNLIGVDDPGLMHLKTRLFTTPDATSLITGSFNPGDDAVWNDETFHLITEPAIVAGYAAAYDAVLRGTGITNAWDDGASLNVLFSPEVSGPRAGAKMLEWLGAEDEQILLMVFSIRDFSAPGQSKSLIGVLADRVAAGVPVYVITDRNQSDGWGDTTEDRLRAVGVHVWEVDNNTTEFTAMHHKVAVLGRSAPRVITDAANWSAAGLGSRTAPASNVESTLFISAEHANGRTGRRYLGEWMKVLERYRGQGGVDGEPGYDKIFDDLTSQDGWPRVPVSFVADGETRWGETLRVVGDLPELGVWGLEGPGLALSTDADTYPTWTGSVGLPIGTPFLWKLVAEQDGAMRWEAGADRASLAQPDAAGDEGMWIEAAWR